AQTVTVTAMSNADSTRFASATISLEPSSLPSISVTPSTASLYGGQSKQFSATVLNEPTPSVYWSISPSGVGTINNSGVYIAPATISSQQTIAITATSQADASVFSSATVTLLPTQCASSGYGYVRAITIDHTKIPNSDQVDFPLLFSTTDAAFKSVAHSGH